MSANPTFEPVSPQWLAGVAAERQRCLAILANYRFGSNRAEHDLLTRIMRRVEGVE